VVRVCGGQCNPNAIRLQPACNPPPRILPMVYRSRAERREVSRECVAAAITLALRVGSLAICFIYGCDDCRGGSAPRKRRFHISKFFVPHGFPASRISHRVAKIASSERQKSAA
jgi:hypothetical protein